MLEFIDATLFDSGLEICTPDNRYLIVNGRDPLTIFLKNSLLTRLLYNRLDFEMALQNGLIRCSKYTRDEIIHLSQVFKYNNWFIPAIDFI